MFVDAGRRSGLPFWILAVLALVSTPRAAKVLLYKSFFGTTPVCLSGGPFVDNTCTDSADGLLRDNGRGWLQIVLPDEVGTVAYQNVQFTLNKQGTWSNDYLGNLNTYTYLRTSDTVWLAPDPFPGGANVKATVFDPTGPGRVKVVMFWSPWTGGSPRLQVGSVSDTMTPLGPNSGLFGWYAQTLVGYAPSTNLVFSNNARTQFLSSGGLGTSQTPAISIDSIAATSDTVWIRAYPEVGATGVRSTRTLQRPRQIMVFNPWDGFQPNIQQPRIRFGASDTLRTMVPNADFCGWYSLPYFERAPRFHLVNRKTGQTFGAAGYGSAADIDASALGDTAWVTVAPDRLPRLSSTPTLDRGVCEITYLAATVRDFASSRAVGTPLHNREFGPGKGCWRGGWSVVKGMVDTLLGPGRKPVRSAHDTGSFYPNGWTWANRCTYDTLPGTRAEVGDSGIATNWFRTVPGKNAETCRDIPLTLDSVNGNYVNNSPRYFPIDDFSKLEDGSDNPFFDRINGEDGRSHNYGFCLESHGSFEYRKGQTFKFRGDDDVWFFIDNRLVVDLGGIHPAATDSVVLDTIGRVVTNLRWVNNRQVGDTSWSAARLVEGRTYSFDFFFCERSPQGSSMLIETSMNLRTSSGFQLRDTVLGPGRTSYDLYASRISGQGCRAQTLVAKATGRFFLSGPGIVRRPLASGATHYGGIVLAAGGGKATVDTSAIVGLPAGDYQILAVSDLDTTKTEIIRFRVPFTTGPRFVAKPAYTGATGSSFAVEVAAFSANGPDSASIAFTMQPTTGLVFYRDSLLLSPLAAGDTLRTGANTRPRRLWVKGVLPGTYTLAVGKAVGDSADLWPDVVFLPARPVFRSKSPYTGTVGSVVAAEVVAVNASGTDSSAAVFGLRPIAGLEFFADSLLTRRLGPNDTLRTGINGLPRRLWVRGAAAGTYTLVVGSTSLDSTDSRPGIVFQDKGLRFTTAAGVPLDPFALERPLGDTIRLWFETFAGTGTCTACGSSVVLSSDAAGIVFLGAGGLPTTTAPLVSGRGTILVRGLQPVDLATLRLQVSSDSTARALWSPVSFTVSGPDSAVLEDRDGDGRADALVVHLRQGWAATNTVTGTWPAAAAPLVLGAPTLSMDSLTATFPVVGAPLATTGSAAGSWSWSTSTAPKSFPVEERLAPVPLRAVLSRGTPGTPDTLRVRVSETVTSPSLVPTLERLEAGSWIPSIPASGSLQVGNTLVLLHSSSSSTPAVGDSVRLDASVVDARGNVPAGPRRAVVVEGAGPPPVRGWLLDLDADGAIDHARILYPVAVDPSTAGTFAFRLEPGALVRPAGAPTAVPGAANLLQVALQTPFPEGITSVASGSFGVVEVANLPGLDGPTRRQDAFPLSDSVPPVVRSAFLRLAETYEAPDTLVVVATEPVSASGARVVLGHDRRTESILDPSDSRWTSPETLVILQWPSDVAGLRAGDSVRWTFDGTLLDAHGNVPSAAARRRVVSGGVRKPVLRLEPPRALTVFSKEQQFAIPSLPGIQIQAGSGTDARIVDPASGAVTGGIPCPENRCLGPTLELNQPVRATLLVYDRLGVHVTGTDVDISQAVLDAIGTDRLGRTTVRLRWDLADDRARPVAGGIYLLRLLVSRPSDQGTVFVANQVWKVGVKRDETP